MLSNLEVLSFIRKRGGARGESTLEVVAHHFEINEMSARGHLARLWRNGHIRPLETRDALEVKLPFPQLSFHVTAKGIKRLAYMRRGRVSGSLFDRIFEG
jgi:predicted ArsR family transcriptional regulator